MFYNKLDILRTNGKYLGELLEYIGDIISSGMSTYDLDQIIEEKVVKGYKAYPSFKGYNGYPAASCISLNEEVVHGIPKKNVIIQDGDIVSVDIGIYKNGMHVDAARTYKIGNCDQKKIEIVEVAEKAFFYALSKVKVGNTIGDIGYYIQTFVESRGYSVIRDLVGHGIGEELHMEPQVPNYGRKGEGPIIRENMVLAIEPMITAGSYKIKVKSDNWTIVPTDMSLSAHYENTVIFTTNGNEVITL